MKLAELWIVMAMPIHGDTMPAGQYDNVLREPFEVFQLTNLADGSFPLRERPVFRMAERLNPQTGIMSKFATQEIERMAPWPTPDGEPAHMDFSDYDEEWRGVGNEFAGEVMRGWMRRVPHELVQRYGLTPMEGGILPICGIYTREHETVQEILNRGPRAPVQRPTMRTGSRNNQPYFAQSKGAVERPYRGEGQRKPNQRGGAPST